MSRAKRLSVEQLFTPVSLPEDFAQAVEEGGERMFGQSRAETALHFGIGIKRPGFNIYARGSGQLGVRNQSRRHAQMMAKTEPPASDWCYIHNFDDPRRPLPLGLPAGQGRKLQMQMEQLVEDFRSVIPKSFASKEFTQKTKQLEGELENRQQQALADLESEAAEDGIALLDTPTGYSLVAMKDGELIDEETFDKLPEDEQKRIHKLIEDYQQRLKRLIREEFPLWFRETNQKLADYKRQVIRSTVTRLINEIREQYPQQDKVQAHLDRICEDATDNVEEFLRQPEGNSEAREAVNLAFNRYRVNVITDNSDTEGAPVVEEPNPTLRNLVGRVEHMAQFGTLLTDHTFIRAGALHRANGGYLILDALKLLTSPFSWEVLKRALFTNTVTMESIEQELSLPSSTTLEPEAIPLKIKVLLTGSHLLHALLCAYDRDFERLFQVTVDFSDDLPRDAESLQGYARLFLGIAEKEGLRQPSTAALERLLEHSFRLSGRGSRMSLKVGQLLKTLHEADYWAEQDGSDSVEEQHILQALEAERHRDNRLQEHLLEEIESGTIAIRTEGKAVGMLNGLSVIDDAGYSFGQPSRISASVRAGSGEVVDIEREADMGGDIHAKGVLILQGFLAHQFGKDTPISLHAALAFEQSYGFVEGDSASAAELCALLSAIADTPLDQGIAITGSVDQKGHVQAVGGINEKIEGFFDACRLLTGLNGRQGVVIPESNAADLMLRPAVREAVGAGRFHIYTATHVDDMLALLSGLPAGRRSSRGNFTPNSFHARVLDGLRQLLAIQQQTHQEQES